MQYDQVGVIPFRRRPDGIEVLLITSRTRGRWICPKGNIEAGLGRHQSAQLEAFEEAGVEGRIVRPALGIYRHGDPPQTSSVRIYLLEVEREHASWPEDGERSRQWVHLDRAKEQVDEAGLRDLLREAASRLEAIASE